MANKHDRLPRVLGSNLSLDVDEAEPNSDVPPLSSVKSQRTCATLVVDDGSPARFSLDLPATTSVETMNPSSIMREKYLEAFNRPDSPSNPLLGSKLTMPGEPPLQTSHHLTSCHYLHDQDDLLNLTSPIKQQGSRNRYYFPPGVNHFSNSPATGKSSSIDGIKKASFMADALDSDSFIEFTRISSKVNTCRRAPSTLSLPPLHSTGAKSLPESISLPNPNIEWVERRSENSHLSGPSNLSPFFRILSAFFTSNSPPELTSPSLHNNGASRFPPESNLWKMIVAIPRLVISLIQYIISPWIGWLSLPEFFLRKKFFGDTIGPSKFRRKRFSSSISVIYGLFCVFMFTSWILLKMGFSNRNLIASREEVKLEFVDRKAHYSVWDDLISFIYPSENQYGSNSEEDQWNPQLALKRRVNLPNSLEKTQAPLNSIPHMTRFSKLHSKSNKQESEEVTPILFQGTITPDSNSITACLFSNQFWLDRITFFLKNWDGPVSLVVECFYSDQAEVISRIEKLREMDSLIQQRVDFHLVSTPDGTPIQRIRNAERMLVDPTATNAHLNLARFFSRSDMVWLVGDARVLPSLGLYKILSNHVDLRARVLDYGDAIIVPNFAFNREKLVFPKNSWSSESSDLNELAQQYIDETLSSIPLPTDQWPKTRQELLNLSTETRIPDSNLTILTMYDQAWEPKKGPSNWTMWRKYATEADFSVIKKDDDGSKSNSVVIKNLEGGGDELYPIVRYDLQYAPNVIVSRESQPWCTERFEYNKAACIYQMYLTGTELWVLPKAWSLTVEQISHSSKKYNDDEALKELISSRLYSKFHQEACMHYGREFSSLGAWEDDRSKHAKAICMHVLSSWGVGTSSSNIVL